MWFLGGLTCYTYNSHRPPIETCNHFDPPSTSSRMHLQSLDLPPYSISYSSRRLWHNRVAFMSDMCHPCMSSTASTMPSLPKPSPVAMHASQDLTQHNHRETSYHMDGQGQYAIQSYEIRAPSRHSVRTPPPRWRRLQPTDYSRVLHSIKREATIESTSGSRGSNIVAQSREACQLDKARFKDIAANPPKSLETPPAPRPRRLSTPDLSDLDEDRPFCSCDTRMKCNSKKGCLNKTCRRDLS